MESRGRQGAWSVQIDPERPEYGPGRFRWAFMASAGRICNGWRSYGDRDIPEGTGAAALVETVSRMIEAEPIVPNRLLCRSRQPVLSRAYRIALCRRFQRRFWVLSGLRIFRRSFGLAGGFLRGLWPPKEFVCDGLFRQHVRVDGSGAANYDRRLRIWRRISFSTLFFREEM